MQSMVEGFSDMTVHQARSLRRTMSHPEVILWHKFRRQHPHGPFTLDFFCCQAKLAIEIDGFAHDCGAAPAHDARRDQWLAAQGLDTMRFAASDVQADVGAVVAAIVFRCSQRTPPPASAGPPPRENARRIN
jgi:very-short-patch-repair endonuclease